MRTNWPDLWRPTLAQGYAPAGSAAPQAEQGQGSNTARRIAVCLDVETGRLLAWQRAHFDRDTLLKFYEAVEQSYPQAEQIFLIHDNWPVQWHPELLAGLRGSKLALVGLPTYAPWRESRGEGLAQIVSSGPRVSHPWVDAWERLQSTIKAWLEQWADGSLALLRYVGPCPI